MVRADRYYFTRWYLASSVVFKIAAKNWRMYICACQNVLTIITST